MRAIWDSEPVCGPYFLQRWKGITSEQIDLIQFGAAAQLVPRSKEINFIKSVEEFKGLLSFQEGFS